MRQFGISLLILAILAAICCNACRYNTSPQNRNADKLDKERFTDDEIREDIKEYMRMLLGEKPPTLQNYYNFEGDSAELEDVFELDECSCRGLKPDSSECAIFVQDRQQNSSREPSYYYEYLRSILPKDSERLIIHKIRSPTEEAKSEVGQLIVEASIGKTRLEFYHTAVKEYVASLGLVGILTIDNVSNYELVKKRKNRCQEE